MSTRSACLQWIGLSLRRLTFGLGILTGVVAVGLALYSFVVSGQAREPMGLADLVGRNQIRFVLNADKSWRAVCYCGMSVSSEDIPQFLKQALVATEDQRFMIHNGVNIIGMIRASLANREAGQIVQGGSTLTQQLVKFTLLNGSRDTKRKITEAGLAVQLEAVLSKDEIITLYLNRADFGSHDGDPIIGVEQASRVFFRKHVRDLDLIQAAMLVAMLKSPTDYNPKNNPAAAEERAAVVLQQMVHEGYLSATQRDVALRDSGTKGNVQPLVIEKRYFGAWIGSELTKLTGIKISPQLRVFVSLDPAEQFWAEHEIGRTSALVGSQAQGALVSLDTQGWVQAYVGGNGFSEHQWDKAGVAKRQPASTFKAFVYLAAMEAGLSPTTIMSGAAIPGLDEARNYDGKYPEHIGLEAAFAHSVNTVAVRLGDQVGPARIAEIAHRVGIHSELKLNRTLALGTSEVSLLELTGAYGVFATLGQKVVPRGILAVKDSDTGETLYIADNAETRVVSPDAARLMRELLRAVVTDGTGTGANVRPDAAGKTGTSQDSRDAWFVGYTDDRIVGIWFGREDNKSIPALSGSVAAAAWGRFVLNCCAR